MSEQAGIFDDLQPPTPQEALAGLSDSLNRLIQLPRQGSYSPADLAAAQKEAFVAVHEYAGAWGIADDEEGMEFRLNLAQAIGIKVQNGINPLESQLEFNPYDFVDKARQTGALDTSPDEQTREYFRRLAGPTLADYNASVTSDGDVYSELANLDANDALANDWQ